LKIALGTAQFGLNYGIANLNGQIAEKHVNDILFHANYSGIDTLDTAAAYGNSEACLGRAVTDSFKIITKLDSIPFNNTNTYDWALQQLEISLAKLNKKSIYGILLHRPQELLGPSGADLYKALKAFKEKGLVKKIGISIYSPNELEKLMQKFTFDIVQSPLNLIDNRLVSSGWLDILNNNNVEVHTRSSFLQGLLLMKKKDIPQKFMTWNHIWQKWHNWLLLKKISPVEACLAYPLSFSEINRVIVGVDSKSHLNEIISVANKLKVDSFPEIGSSDQNLINPAKWDKL